MTDSEEQLPPRVATDRNETPLGAYPPFERLTISAEDIAGMPARAPGPVTLQDRQGVFVHSFKCSICDLEFVVFSWRANRHQVGSTFCPECGKRTPMIHWRAQTSDSPDFSPEGPGLEICRMFPPLDGSLMDDTVVPADDRYTFSTPSPDPYKRRPRPTSRPKTTSKDQGHGQDY